jgi:hypothetical protein
MTTHFIIVNNCIRSDIQTIKDQVAHKPKSPSWGAYGMYISVSLPCEPVGVKAYGSILAYRVDEAEFT